MKKLPVLAICLIMLPSLSHAAELRFSQHYSSNMVLQRDKSVLIRGFSDKGAEVAVSFADQTQKSKADARGEWAVTFDPLKASAKGGELKASAAGDTAVLKNILVGDVFLFARQTSIDVSLGKNKVGEKAAADVPAARVMIIKTLPAIEPQKDLAQGATSGWVALDKQVALKMSAAAFYTAKDLAKTSDVPIGFIDLNMGYHFPIAWLSKEALKDTVKVFDSKKTTVEGSINTVDNMFTTMEKALAEFDDEEALKEAASRRPDPVPHPREDARFPAAGYNSVLHPMRGLALKGLLLQLGNNYPYILYNRRVSEGTQTSRAHLGQTYKDSYDLRKWGIYLEPITTPRIPREWRKYFGDESLAIGWITPPGSDLVATGRHHREMRELQRRSADAEKGVDLILAGTKHVPFSAQPSDEALLGARCSAWVKGAIYKENDAAPTGPVFERVEMKYSKAQLFFKPGTAEGLKASPGALNYFEVAGSDLEYSPAKASVDGETIRLSSDKVSRIAHVRYNWTEYPDQGLLNAAGLPAAPFMTALHVYPRTIDTKGEEDLPEEFSLPISEWKNEGAIVLNSRMSTAVDQAKYYLGSTGLRVSPFGPNLYVNSAYIGSPADGKILSGDYLYGVNEEVFGDEMLVDIAEAITLAESEKGQGKISFELMRGGNKMTIELQLEVLGTYSSTSPYDCPKSDRIVANAEAFLAERGGVVPGTHPVWQNSDAMFLLAAGSPEHQGLVRRRVYERMANRDLSSPVAPVPPKTKEEKEEKKNPGGPWDLSADMLLVAEYYHATGDRNVLPYLKDLCDSLTSIQIRELDAEGPWPQVQQGQTGGWRHNFYGGAGYGTMAAIGVPAVLGYHLTHEAGVEFDTTGYERAVRWFMHNGAQIGNIYYGYSAKERTTGNFIDPDKLAAGQLNPGNGAVGGAAVLFDLMGDGPVARTCSFVATHAYNNTWGAHGGHFWLNMYTPLGAKVHGKKAFQFYMKGNRTWQELHRMFDYSRQENRYFGAGQYIAYVAPKERLRILGAHESVFVPNPPALLKSALDAYHKRDYAASEKAASAVIAKAETHGLDMQKAEQLRDAAVLIQKSIAHDFLRLKKLMADKKHYEASLDLAQLKAVMPEGHAELAAIEKELSAPETQKLMGQAKKEYETGIKSLALQVRPIEEEGAMEWQPLVSRKVFRGKPTGVEPTAWRMKIIESMAVAPEDWMETKFDDSSWMETTMPISWQMNHTALFRAEFDVADKKAIKSLRLDQYAYRQENMKVYINGELVAIISAGGGRGGANTFELSEHAIKALKKGSNTIAATYQHCWRWGTYGSKSQTESVSSVKNQGVHLALDMR